MYGVALSLLLHCWEDSEDYCFLDVMVKGNWERRAELADVRRAEAKAKKLARRQPKAAAPESVVNKLIRDESIATLNCLVWLENNEAVKVCSAHFRGEMCGNKKCRIFHPSSTIAHLRGVPLPGDGDAEMEDVACNEPILLHSVETRQLSRIRFISVDGRCVFDATQPGVWDSWYTERNQQLKENTANLKTITESEERDDDDDEDDNDEGNIHSPEAIVAASAGAMPETTTHLAPNGYTAMDRSPLLELVKFDFPAFAHVFVFISNDELLHLMMGCW